MASLTPMSHPQSVYKKPHFAQPTTLPHLGFLCFPSRNPNFSSSSMVLGQKLQLGVKPSVKLSSPGMTRAMAADTTSSSSEQKKERYPGESKGFVEEMRFVAMRLHTKDQAREGKKTAEGPEEKSPTMWKPTVEGYLKFLVDSKLVYETLERIVEKASVPYYAEFRNTGLERSEKLEKDLEWFKEQGYDIPEPSEPGRTYSSYLTELSETDPQAFICHFYNVYFAHSAGGRMIGRKVAETLINKMELEFYKWDGDLPQLLQNVRDKLNKVAQSWSREEKNHCLEETEKSFKHSGELLRLILQTAE